MNYTIPSNVIDVKYYNFKDLSGKHMNCEITADKGTEFISLPFHFSDDEIRDCLVPNEEQFITAIDNITNNPIYSICIVCSESFYKYFIPAFRYLGSKELDNWKLRYKYVKFITDIFNNPLSKQKFIDYATNSSNTDINEFLLQLDDNGYVILNRSKLYFSTLPLLETIVNDFGGI